MKSLITIVSVFFLLVMNLEVEAQSKKEEKEKAYQLAVEKIETGTYEFNGAWAIPQKGGQINLQSNPNFLKIDEENASADLPYFGRLTGGAAGYGSSSGGIEFDNELIDYTVKKNDKKRRVIITFKVRKNTESFTCTLTVNTLNSATLSISSINRQPIRYNGSLVKE